MKKRLVTAALPYVNNIPHLGNLLQVLSADVFARFCRLRGYQTRYICGTDEYGTATETKALELGKTAKELCDYFHSRHAEIYEWFEISFDIFGRTTDVLHSKITQSIFLSLWDNKCIKVQEIEQLYSEASQLFLADRYVVGTCPYCRYDTARGDQCEQCGKLLEPTELINPRSTIDNSKPVIRRTQHLYIDLPALADILNKWVHQASERGHWANNAVQMTKAWIRDGLKLRAITRDLRWGIPVPMQAYRDKVFYVWFDAPIGYISITACLADDWESWWKNPNEVQLYQFVGKDNIPFHTVLFPAALLGTGESWTMLHHISSTEYLNYETGSFSKSARRGIFADDARNTGIPADVWRFFLMYNRPESSDYHFSWKEFQQHINGELIGNFSNLVNRTVRFWEKYLTQEHIVNIDIHTIFWQQVEKMECQIENDLESVRLRKALHSILKLCDVGNQYFQAQKPWELIKVNISTAARIISDLLYLIRDLAVLLSPYIPETTQKIAIYLGSFPLSWGMLSERLPFHIQGKLDVLFRRLEDGEIQDLSQKYSGTLRHSDKEEPWSLDLCSARIISLYKHPNADKLYILQIDDGVRKDRTIVSGLVPYYNEKELQGTMIVLVRNLQPVVIRGVKSEGMLLAANDKKELEILRPPLDCVGCEIFPQEKGKIKRDSRGANDQKNSEENQLIAYDAFCSIKLYVEEGVVKAGNFILQCADKPLQTTKIKNGEIS